MDVLPVNYSTMRYDRSMMLDDHVARLLAPLRRAEATYQVPMHVLAIARKPLRPRATAMPPTTLAAGQGASR